MTIALLNQRTVGKATFPLHLAGQWARQGKRITPIGIDQRGSPADWSEQRERQLAARDREAGGMTGCGLNGAFAARPRDVGSCRKSSDSTASRAMAADPYTARPTAGITPALCGRIEIAAFERGVIAAAMSRNPMAREFPDTNGDCS